MFYTSLTFRLPLICLLQVAEAAKTADRLLGVGISFLDALNDFFHKDANKEERR